MARTLFGRQGDAQALKVCAAAQLSGQALAFTAVPSLQELRAMGSNAFGTNTLVLPAGAACTLTEPNACCTFLGAFAQ